MYLNEGTRIAKEAGDYVVLVDYGEEGLVPQGQFLGLPAAIEAFQRITHSPKVIVKLVHVTASETC
jgi:hypothetical protein